jgi:hypothetical protein
MGADRQQINVRVDDESTALIERLLPVVSRALGLAVNKSDLFRLGLRELALKYLSTAPAPGSPAPKPAPPTRRRRRG